MFANAQSSRAAADAVVATLTAATPPFRVQTSQTARQFVGLKLADLDGGRVQGLTRTWVAAG